MKRYELRIDRAGQFSHLAETIDGAYIRYEDHVEAMKRIAGAPVAHGLTDEQIEAIWQATPTEGIHYIYGEPAKELRIRFARAILAQAAPSASAQQAEPVAHVPVHPRNGPLWSDTIPAGSELQRSESYPLMALYAAPAPSASPAALTVRNIAEALIQLDAIYREQQDEPCSRPMWLATAHHDAEALLAASPADQVEDARDAARYRWLRDHESWEPFDSKFLNAHDLYGRDSADMDRAIDAAMSATPPAA